MQTDVKTQGTDPLTSYATRSRKPTRAQLHKKSLNALQKGLNIFGQLRISVLRGFLLSWASIHSKRGLSTTSQMLGWYQARLAARPLLTQSITTSVLFAVGDITAQQLVEKKGFQNHDLARTGRMALYGGSMHISIHSSLISPLFPT